MSDCKHHGLCFGYNFNDCICLYVWEKNAITADSKFEITAFVLSINKVEFTNGKRGENNEK